ncbi:iron-sulfur cluster repair di-iron protein [Fulvivirga kasyanovii]|uniref:Iron-sulfur cluster repair di-iron protein n=1 Tax=Fulvivirga kasyanovii TaxID=396812 RepID=A0ABW9RMN4_9BACT|nr:iron-sulfur cluster repair di-iron protein [Fulvivirga kasyanovii]MTI24180.1 iron-sulfur cluster repair di-iron protein [Fulvivirga kasyanovii]
MKLSKDTPIGELVAANYRTATVFKKHKIDFCCQGGRTIREAVEQKEIDINLLLKELDEAIQIKDTSANNYQSWPLGLLADYIEKVHHRYVEKRTQEIVPFLNKLCRVHGDRHPELHEITDLFTKSAGDLAQHMKKEELILFPFIHKMVRTQNLREKLHPPHFKTIENPIAMMMHEHDAEGERFRKIAELSNNYNPPADACNTYRVTFALLKEFEDDLHLHIHLENNILFPRAMDMENNIEKAQPEGTDRRDN